MLDVVLAVLHADGTFRAQPTTTLHDRFFLGGLPSVRGFGPSGLGPRAPPMEGGCVKGRCA